MDQNTENGIKRAGEALKGKFVLVGKGNIKPWHIFLGWGVLIGLIGAIVYVANPQGRFEPGKADSVFYESPTNTSYTLTIADVARDKIELGRGNSDILASESFMLHAPVGIYDPSLLNKQGPLYISSVSLALSRRGTPAYPLTVTIREGSPTAGTVLGKASVDSSSAALLSTDSGNPTWREVKFSSPVKIASEQQYFLTVNTDQTNRDNYYIWSRNNGNPYAEGSLFRAGNWRDSEDALAKITYTDAAPSITVLSPNGGEKIIEGSDASVLFKLNGIPLPLSSNLGTVGYLKQNGNYVGMLFGATTINADGSAVFTWEKLKYLNLENTAISSAKVGSGYTVFYAVVDNDKVRAVLGYYSLLPRDISGKENQIFLTADESDAPFSIVAPSRFITVVSPNGGEIWDVGQTYEIKWSHYDIDKVMVYVMQTSSLHIDQGINVPVSLGSTSGLIKYTVPSNAPPASTYKVWLIGYKTNVGQVQDWSDAPFSIVSFKEI